MDGSTDEQIKKANKELHGIEARYYDILHSEIWNFYEHSKTRRDLRKIAGIIEKETLDVLDVGAGTGNLTLKFLAGGNTVTALDICREMLNVLSEKIPTNFNDNIELVCEDVDEFLLKTTQKYDVISFSSVLHHLPNYLYTLNLASSQLVGGGVIYITHEPLPRLDEIGFFYRNTGRVLGLFDYYLNRFRLSKYSKLELPDLDYSVSDIHSREGIDPKELVEFLKSKCMEIEFYKEYGSYKSGIVSILGNFLSDGRHLKLIARNWESA